MSAVRAGASPRAVAAMRQGRRPVHPWLIALAAGLVSCAATFARPAGAADLSHAVVGGHSTYCVRPTDTLTSISARFGESLGAIVRANAIDPRKPIFPGQCLRIDNRHVVPATLQDGILVNIPQRMLFFFSGDALAAAYPVGLGRPTWPTPTGPFHVVEMRQDPTWHVPVSIQQEMRRTGKPVLIEVPPGPDNPLGRYWMGLSIDGYGIHGTNAPPSVYHFQSHGCIRLHPDDAQWLFSRVHIGTPGELIYSPVLLASLPDGQILLEVDPDIYRRRIDASRTVRDLADRNGLTARIDWQRAMQVIRSGEGVATRIDLAAATSPVPELLQPNSAASNPRITQ